MCIAGGWDRFVGRRSITKTLQFKLRPVGNTQKKLDESGCLGRDLERDLSKSTITKWMDRAHKDYIEMALSTSDIDWTGLQEALSSKETREKLEGAYRKRVVAIFNTGTNRTYLDQLFSKDVIDTVLPTIMARYGCSSAEKDVVAGFHGFFGYLDKFNKSRKNLYSDKAKATAISYRIVNENFPMFVGNMAVFEAIMKTEPRIVENAEKNLAAYMESKHIPSLETVFSVGYYNKVLTQTGIDAYNTLIGGFSVEGGIKVQGLNELVNLYNQTHPDNRLPLFVSLYKQLLGDCDSASFRDEQFSTDDDVIEVLSGFCTDLLRIGQPDSLIQKLCDQFAALDQFDATKLIVSKNDLSTLSQSVSGSWDSIMESMRNGCKTKKEEKALDKKKYFTLAEIGSHVDYSSYWSLDSDVQKINDAYAVLHYLWDGSVKELKEYNGTDTVQAIRELVESILDFYRKVSVLQYSEDPHFIGEFVPVIIELGSIVSLFSRVRNYMTRKVSDTLRKYRLMFDCSSLGKGWDNNKEQDYCITLFSDGVNYYLGIINPKNKVNFAKVQMSSSPVTGNEWKKMRYRQLTEACQTLPRCFFTKKRLEDAAVVELKKIHETYKANKDYNKNRGKDLPRRELSDEQRTLLIDGYKSCIANHPAWGVFDFHFKKTSEYRSVEEFYHDVDMQSYRISYDYIDKDVLMSLVDEGKLFLFQIYNQDFAPGATGKGSLHTNYWRYMFSEENMRDMSIALNGGVEFHYRFPTSKKMPKHEIGDILVNKTTNDGEPVPLNVLQELKTYYNDKQNRELSDEAISYVDRVGIKIADRELIQGKRFTEPLYRLSVPITINPLCGPHDTTLNQEVLNELHAHSQDFTVLGIDRGERNLIYICLTDMNRNIILQKSMNIVGHQRDDGKVVRQNYQKKLDQREKERTNERKSWKEISGIKDLKSGYLSQVVSEIVRLAVENNAIIVMEDLNFGFKRGRGKFEKSCYQQFEKALLNKLGYLAFKDRSADAVGGILHGYQLASEIKSFKKIGRQAGIVFFVPAAYTSKQDPTTGFYNFIGKVRYESVDKAKKLIDSKIKAFRYNADRGYFEFDVHQHKESTKTCPGVDRDWTICTQGDLRWVWNAQNKSAEAVNVTARLKELFVAYGIGYEDGEDLKEKLMEQDEKSFFAPLLHLIGATLQIRYSNNNAKKDSEKDFVLSPVQNDTGEFFDSRKSDGSLPKDGDANGAYNIALRAIANLGLNTNHENEEQDNAEDGEYIQTNRHPSFTNYPVNDTVRV